MSTLNYGNTKDDPDKIQPGRQPLSRKEIPIKAYTHKQLAALYDVNWRTMDKWLKEHKDVIGKRHGHFYSPRQVEVIFVLCGWPGERKR